MHMIMFLLMFAELQAERGGRGVSVKYILSQCNLSRSTVHRRLNELIKGNIVVKPKRGQYFLKRTYGLQAIGYCVNTTLDHMIYSTNVEKSGMWGQ